VLSFDDEDARAAGALRAQLEAAGRPIVAYDLVITAQALRHKLTLVTANVEEFRPVEGLVCRTGPSKCNAGLPYGIA